MPDDKTEKNGGADPTRSEVAEYLHDIAGQLAEMARTAGFDAAAEAFGRARRAIESDF